MGYVPVQTINTGGMSITLLIEQNVYRYYALTEHTLSLLFTRHQVFPIRVTSPFIFFFFCSDGLSPAFVFSLVVGRYFEPQRLEMVTVDKTKHKKKQNATKTDRLSITPICGTPLHRAVDSNIHSSHSPLWIFRQWFVDKLNPNTSVLWFTVEYMAILIQMLASHHLSQQHITSTLLTFTHDVYFRCVVCLLFFSYWTKIDIIAIFFSF